MNAIISWVFPVLQKHSTSTPFFFFALMMLIDFVVIAVLYPETKGISLEELEHKLGLAAD
jgi:SP family arabinose:H+ symporter-like MFS transporter